MISDRIEKIEATLKGAATLPDETRRQLLELLTDLKAEIAPLSATHGDDVQSIARFAEASVHETVRPERTPELAEAALQGLRSSVEGFEASHPQLVGIVNRIAVALSNMGI